MIKIPLKTNCGGGRNIRVPDDGFRVVQDKFKHFKRSCVEELIIEVKMKVKMKLKKKRKMKKNMN